MGFTVLPKGVANELKVMKGKRDLCNSCGYNATQNFSDKRFISVAKIISTILF